MSDDKNDIVSVKIITGERISVAKKNIVGYCHFSEHKGVITKNELKSRECAKKECHYFEKNTDNEYWYNIEHIQEVRKRKAKNAKRRKKEEEERLRLWIETAQQLSDNLGYDLKVINLKKVPGKKKYILYYISKCSENDCFRYTELARQFGSEINAKIALKHIIDINGYYAIY